MAGWLLDDVIKWLLAKAVLATLTALWGLLEQTVFTNPDVTMLPQVAAISSRSQTIVNAAFVLAIIAIGATVMTHETVQVRYGVGDLIPRMVVGFIAANFATPICSKLIETANALTGAITGDGITAEGSFQQLQHVVEDALNNDGAAFILVVIGLIIAVLTGMLLVAYLVRIGVLVVLAGIAPLALACHATPFTEAVAKLWWRSMFGVLATVVLQALAMYTALSVFLDPNADVGSLGIPDDATGVGALFIVACLLWVVVKIPGMMRRYVTRGSAHSSAGLFLRMILIQAVSQMVRLPFGRRGGRAGTAAGAGRAGRTAAGTAGGPNVANTVIPYWRPRMPRPTPGGTRPAAPATSSSTPNRGASPAGGTSTTRAATGGGASTSASPSGSRPAGLSGSPPPPPIPAAGLTPTPPPSAPRPVIPPGVNPATAMPKTRPVGPPVSGPWNSPPRPPRPPRPSRRT